MIKLENMLCFPISVKIAVEIIKELQDEDVRYFWDVNRETFRTKYYKKRQKYLETTKQNE